MKGQIETLEEEIAAIKDKSGGGGGEGGVNESKLNEVDDKVNDLVAEMEGLKENGPGLSPDEADELKAQVNEALEKAEKIDELETAIADINEKLDELIANQE